MNAVKNPMIGDTLYVDTHKTGLKIVVWPQPEASSVYAVFATKYGSVYNTLPTPDGGTEEVPEGIAHYLEHKLFESEGEDAFVRYAATGANANAYTSFDRTAYLFHATENVLPSLEILLDFVQDPYFTEETVQKEQGIIGQEIRMGEDQPGRRVFFNLLEAVYHNHPVRVDIAGTVDTIARITPELLYRCYHRYYNLHNMVLVVAGNITPDEVMTTADRLLKPCEEFIPADFPVDEPDTVKQEYVEVSMPVASPLFYLGFKEPAKVQTALSMAGSRLLTQLMAGRTSRLYNRLMDEGLINDQFEAEYMFGPGHNMWLFGGESSDPKRVKAILCEEIARLQAEGLDAEEVEACRRGAYGRLVAGLDDPTECGELIQANLIDGIEPLAELEALAKVTIEDLQAQLSAINVQACALSVVNPV
ncbi:MAG: insulinase family protein [Ruminococcaceae bacterium]|nr:insulinase family protein [Oscillospiraceae bacterium]